MICLRAHRLIKRRWRVRLPKHQPAPAIRSLAEGYNRLVHLYNRYADAERLARMRAFKLRRLYDAIDPLGRIDHRPAEQFTLRSRRRRRLEGPIAPLFLGFGLFPAFAPSLFAPRIRAPP